MTRKRKRKRKNPGYIRPGKFPRYVTRTPDEKEVWMYDGQEIELEQRDDGTWRATFGQHYEGGIDKQDALAEAKSELDRAHWIHDVKKGWYTASDRFRLLTDLEDMASLAGDREDFARAVNMRCQGRADDIVCEMFFDLPLQDRIDILNDVWASEERIAEMFARTKKTRIMPPRVTQPNSLKRKLMR